MEKECESEFEVDGIMYDKAHCPLGCGLFELFDADQRRKMEEGVSITGVETNETSIKLPNEVTYEGKTYPVTQIGRYTLSGDCRVFDVERCPNLTSIDIPDSVMAVYNSALKSCSDTITSISIGSGVAFFQFSIYLRNLTRYSVSPQNMYYCDQDGVLFTKDKKQLIAYPRKRECKTYTIPEGTQSIKPCAFYWVKCLEEVVCPSTLKYVGTQAFFGSSIQSIHLSESVEILGGDFDTEANTWCDEDSIFGVFEECRKLQHVTLGNIKRINYATFRYCHQLTQLEIPDSVTEIGYQAFAYSELTAMHIPSSVVKIDPRAFEGCSKVETITVAPDNSVYNSRNDCNAIIETATNRLIRACNKSKLSKGIILTFDALNGCYVPKGLTEEEENLLLLGEPVIYRG